MPGDNDWADRVIRPIWSCRPAIVPVRGHVGLTPQDVIDSLHLFTGTPGQIADLLGYILLNPGDPGSAVPVVSPWAWMTVRRPGLM